MIYIHMTSYAKQSPPRSQQPLRPKMCFLRRFLRPRKWSSDDLYPESGQVTTCLGPKPGTLCFEAKATKKTGRSLEKQHMWKEGSLPP